MKNKPSERHRPRRLIRVFLVLLVLTATGLGLYEAYSYLHGLWQEQCILTDPDRQIEVVTGKMVKRGQVLESFGLRPGVNLATLDFASCRAKTLRSIHTIREIAITRHLPDRMTLVVTEREPLVRLNIRGRSKPDAHGRVADSEGVVFRCFRGTEALPTVREPESLVTPPGGRLTGRSMAALKLLEAASDAEHQSLGMIEADASHPDFILATLGDYSRAKIAWDDMGDGAGGDRTDMLLRLTQLRQAIRTRLATGSVLWNATQKNRIFADTKESFL